MAWWETILRALWLFLPAYAANMAPVFMAKIFPAWNHPVDGGRLARDGRRILGKGKTWRGLAGGALFGGLMALAMAAIAPHWSLVEGLDFGRTGYLGGPTDGQGVCRGTVVAPGSCNVVYAQDWQVALFGAFVGFMALVGDAVKSFFKRRTGRDGGAPWVPFDQLDFVVFGLLAMLAASPILPAGWVWHALTDDWLTPATILLLTPLLHFAVNGIGYVLKLKQVPW